MEKKKKPTSTQCGGTVSSREEKQIYPSYVPCLKGMPPDRPRHDHNRGRGCEAFFIRFLVLGNHAKGPGFKPQSDCQFMTIRPSQKNLKL